MQLSPASVALYGAIAVTTVGMMLVVGGVIAAGLFLPGVVLIGIGMVAFAAAAVLYALHGSAAGAAGSAGGAGAAGARPDGSAARGGR
jgi:hypothetical protein